MSTGIKDLDRKWTMWGVEDIYTGPTGEGQYIPNVDDGVWTWADGVYRVVAVDYETGISTLERQSDKSLSSGLFESDVLLSSKPGKPADTFRIYVNTSVVPHVMAFDGFMQVYGTAASYLKVFKGTDISSKGDVISAQIGSSGNIVSENIMLEMVQTPEKNIRAIKVPETGFVTDTLENGELVTAVVYSASGDVLSVCRLVTVVSNAVRTLDASKKQITDISLISPFLSQTDSLLLEVPVNMTVESIPLTMQVGYNDGTYMTYPIGDDKAQLMGMDNFISSEMGYTSDLVLTYSMSEGEYSMLSKTVGSRTFITKNYRLRTVDAESAYQVKLFMVPVWNFSENRWDLEYYMYSLDRGTPYRVTPYIEYNVNSPQFNGQLYNVAQEIRVAVNLAQINESYNYYRHSTTFTITLSQAATNLTSGGYYILQYNNDDIVGARTLAVVNEAGNSYTLDVSQGLLSGGDVLDSLYWNTEPLYYEYAESSAPAPTHARILVGNNWSRDLPVDELTDVLTNVDAASEDLRQGALVRIEWYRQTQAGTLELGTTGLTIKR